LVDFPLNDTIIRVVGFDKLNHLKPRATTCFRSSAGRLLPQVRMFCVPSSLFRLVSTLVTLGLLAALVGVVSLVLRTAPSAPTNPLVPLTPARVGAPQPATIIPAPQGEATTAGAEVQNAAGGFAFTRLPDFAIEQSATSTTLTSETGAIFLLRGGTPAQLSSAQSAELPVIFQQFVTFYATRDNFQSRNQQAIQIDGAPGLAVDLVSQAADGFAGRIVMAQPATDQLFLLVGISPAAAWTGAAGAAFEQLVASIRFFPLTREPASANRALALAGTLAVTPTLAQTAGRPTTAAILQPTPTPAATTPRTTRSTPTPAFTLALAQQRHPNWRLYSNGNAVNAVVPQNSMIWAATEGGVSAWNRSNNEYAKFTTLDGLTANRTTAVVDCPLPGFGLVFGSNQGLQIFEPQRNRWKTLNSANSELHFDDVTALYCNAEAGFLVVGYGQHGVDLYDVKLGWSLFDQQRGLLDNVVSAITVVGDREQIWVASAKGITVFTEKGVAVYDQSNTPLETTPVTVMTSGVDGIVWLGAGNKVYRIDDDAWTIYSDTYVLASAFPTGAITALAVTSDNTLWIGSALGELCLFDPTVVTCRAFFTNADLTASSGVTGIALDDQERLYVALAQDGVRVFDGQAWQPYTAPAEWLAVNRVRAFAQDVLGFLWLAAESGLYQLDPAAERVVQHFTAANTIYPVEKITTLYAAPGGGLWVGGQSAAYFDGVQWQRYTKADGLAADTVQAIAGDERQRIWFGTPAGLSVWNGESFFTLTRADRLPSNNILTLLADGPAMWIGTDAGLLRFESNRFQVYTTATAALASNRITALAKVTDGALLIGTAQGLSRWVANTMSLIAETRSYPVSAIGLPNADGIWLGTSGEGLFYFDGARWTPAPAAIAPPASAIQAIVVDRQGVVWIAGEEGGLLRYDP
jgi:ligand-binding sensor domain-containing protein